jgi:hypothetical protein
VLRGLIGGGAALLAARAGTSLAAAEKIDVCHYTGSESNPWEQISVAEASWDAHNAHGDGRLGTDAHCGFCGDACLEGASCSDFACQGDSNGGDCPAGSEPGADGCASCPAGTFGAGGEAACQPCAVGSYSTGGAASCTTCECGTDCDPATGACEETTPLICPAGSACQSQCPDAGNVNCRCGTTWTGDPVCYSWNHGCPGPDYCLTDDDCGAGRACINLNNGANEHGVSGCGGIG